MSVDEAAFVEAQNSTNNDEDLLLSTYPVLTLPSELISEIFTHYLPAYPICPPLLGYASPTKLTQICRQWREIAHTTPALWGAVELFMNSELDDFVDLQLETARTWLARSCSLPLSIVLGYLTMDETTKQMEDGIGLFLAHRSRWEYAALIVSSATWIPGPMDGGMRILRQLDLAYSDTNTQRHPITVLDAPHLTTILLDCDFVYWEFVPALAVWSQITRLSLRHSTLSVVAAILRDAPNLVQCKIALNARGAVSPAVKQLYEFLQLEMLIITAGFSDGEAVDEFLMAFRAPNLRRLHIDQDMLSHHPANNLTSIPTILKAMGCRLEQLSIAHPQHSLGTYQEVLPDIGLIQLRHRLLKDWGAWDLQAE
ncbi:F-box domain-containing protein [Mycena chlorophos]|uniref:F-box domain-containing protein n=1 Tax=Mycena chlorophos TaxID=658473 RepID=A0A8H6WKW0_MYCCL|nr:F-box domain-containing protein [Mycena chlorophos]